MISSPLHRSTEHFFSGATVCLALFTFYNLFDVWVWVPVVAFLIIAIIRDNKAHKDEKEIMADSVRPHTISGADQDDPGQVWDLTQEEVELVEDLSIHLTSGGKPALRIKKKTARD